MAAIVVDVIAIFRTVFSYPCSRLVALKVLRCDSLACAEMTTFKSAQAVHWHMHHCDGRLCTERLRFRHHATKFVKQDFRLQKLPIRSSGIFKAAGCRTPRNNPRSNNCRTVFQHLPTPRASRIGAAQLRLSKHLWGQEGSFEGFWCGGLCCSLL